MAFEVRPIGGRRAWSGARGFVLSVAAAGVIGSPSFGNPTEPQDSDPGGVEAYVDERGPWLELFGAWLGGDGDAARLGDAVEFAAPAKEGDEWIERGDSFLVIRSYGQPTSPHSAEDFRSRLMRGRVHKGDARVASKVVGVRPADGGGRVLTVWLEVSGEPEFGMPPVWQLTATVEVRFGPKQEGQAQCRRLELLSFERAQVDQPTFIDKTAATLGATTEVAGVLGVGMDGWASRLDDPALSAFFGHQGLAAGDVNGDGLDDLYVAMPAGMPNLLLVQDGKGGVRDIAGESGVAWLDDTKGVLLVDMDRDGDLDLVSALGHVVTVQLNDGEGVFEMGGFGAAPDQASFYSLAAGDLDRDGVPEIYGTRYVTTRYADAIPIPFEEAQNGPTNLLFSYGNGELKDITAASFPDGPGTQFSLSAAFVDANGDFYPDLYVVNDFGSNRLFLGGRGRKFKDATEASGLADAGAGMGASWGDFDGDGNLDVYVTNMYSSAGRRVAWQGEFAPGRPEEEVKSVRRLAAGNSLFRGDGKGDFARVTDFHAEMGRWGWGGIFTDFEGDGFPDLVVPAGFLTGPKPGDL